MTDKTEQSKWEELEAWAKSCIEEHYADPCEQDINDFIHETADGAHDVIYYYAAWDVVNAARQCAIRGLYDGACDQLRDTEGDKLQDGETLDNVMCRLSYWIHYELLLEAHSEREEGDSGQED